jgi:hypothetical protein
MDNSIPTLETVTAKLARAWGVVRYQIQVGIVLNTGVYVSNSTVGKVGNGRGRLAAALPDTRGCKLVKEEEICLRGCG